MWFCVKLNVLLVLTVQLIVLIDETTAMSLANDYYYFTYAAINESLVSAYNPESQLCCSGKVFESAPNSYQQCCGSSQFDSTRQKCCNGVVYGLKIGHACCGSEYFSVKEAKCCTCPNTGNATLLPFPAEVLGNAESILSMGCCGSKLYNTKTHICCSEMRRYQMYYQARRTSRLYVTDMRRPRMPRRYLPIRREQFTVFERKYSQTGCCNGKIYNKKETTCPSVINHRNLPGTSRPRFTRPRIHQEPRPVYQIPSMYGICNGKSYNVATHLCCTLIQLNGTNRFSYTTESKLVEMTSPQTSCCGLEPYNVERQICCNNKQIHLQNPEGTLECCQSTVYDTSNQRCCEMSELVEDVDNLPITADSCCGKEKIPYDSHTQMCCGNKVFNISQHQTDDPRMIHQQQFCCWDEESGQDASIFSPFTQLCCGGITYENKDHKGRCCGSEKIDWNNDLCCGDKKMSRESQQERCCAHTKYNSQNELCCDFRSGIVVPKKSPSDSCCGKNRYNPNQEMCCRKNFDYLTDYRSHRNEAAVLPRSSPTTICCNMTTIDSASQECCGGKPLERSKQLCCHFIQDNGMYDFAVVDKVKNNSQCCGKESYDPNTQQCCNNTVVESGNPFLDCCGSNVYDRKQQMCCLGNVYDLSRLKNARCCGKNVFNSDKEICCRGVVKNINEPGSAYDCCYADELLYYK